MSLDDRTVKVLSTKYEHYAAERALVVRQNIFNKETILQIRRVVPPGKPEELQIEISITKFGKTHSQTTISSFVCDSVIADLIATACKEVRR